MPEFQPWPKIARLNRGMVITEKIDGTNAAIGVTEDGEVYAQSRTRIVTPEADNFGFAAWVQKHAEYFVVTLGSGLHFGEWWGRGIQRGYGQDLRHFSLFNVARYGPQFIRPDLGYEGDVLPDDSVVTTVPVLYEGQFNTTTVDNAVELLRTTGSKAAPGFMKPEGVVVFLPAARTMFKVTLEGDEKPKGSTEG